MTHCAKATEELERLKFEKGSFIAKLKVRMHLLICSACRKFKQDSDTIDSILQAKSQHNSFKLNENEKQRIISKINA